jgi:hypothetical protein
MVELLLPEITTKLVEILNVGTILRKRGEIRASVLFVKNNNPGRC